MFNDFAELMIATQKDIKALEEATKVVKADTMSKMDDKYKPVREFFNEVYDLERKVGLNITYKPAFLVTRRYYGASEISKFGFRLFATCEGLSIIIMYPNEYGKYDYSAFSIHLYESYERTIKQNSRLDSLGIHKESIVELMKLFCNEWDTYRPILETAVKEGIASAMNERAQRAINNLKMATEENEEV